MRASAERIASCSAEASLRVTWLASAAIALGAPLLKDFLLAGPANLSPRGP